MKISLHEDEMYPVYYISEHDDWGVVADIPEELYNEYVENRAAFHKTQSKLREIYNNLDNPLKEPNIHEQLQTTA